MHAVYSVCFLMQMCIYSFVRSSLKKTMMTIMTKKNLRKLGEINDGREFTDFSFELMINIENVLIKISIKHPHEKHFKYLKI